jgi:hypothetical protein
VLESRKSRLEAEVTHGLRDARTLVAIPRELARRSVVRFPPDSFGKPKPW